MRSLITAIRTLTILPCPGRDADDFSSTLPFFPAVGTLIGGLVVLVLATLTLQAGWTEGAGAVAAVAAILITRGLHVDGLADVSDALGAGRSIERRLAIMKDPHTGAFGVMAITADLLLKAVALSSLAAAHQWTLALLPFIVSRTAQVVMIVSLPYARVEGGKAERFVRGARPLHLVLTLVIASGCCAAVGGLTGMILLLQGLAIAVLLRYWIKRNFGGITGDLIGTTNEVLETGLLVFAAAIAGSLHP
jgi:adenosylcobinamide-GDP ribazoletransferase